MSKNNYDPNLSMQYEASIRYLVEKSNKRAWLVAFLSFIVATLSVVAVALLTPLKSVEPYVIRVNDTTGMVDIITSLDKKDITQNEALDKYFVSTYIKTREGYFYDLLQQDYIKTQILSSPKVSDEYVALYTGERARNDVLKNKFEVRIHINSVVLGDSAGMKVATVRFKEETIDLSSKTSTMTSKIATLSYDYSPDEPVNEQERLENPLGFKVLTYRIDTEINK